MDFRILGPLEALDGGEPVALGGSKRRAVLALLLLHPNETVSSERLIDELWGEGTPATAAKTLQAHVSRLRKALAGGADGPIVTHGHGYELRVGPDDVDSHRFERLLGEARAELADGRPAAAGRLLESALALWRGPPLADLAYEPFAQAEIARLEDLRVAAQEQLVEAKLALGRHADVIGELERLVDAHPYRERLRAQLMLALYRADRQADALQAYQDARIALVEELGIEPGERLRELERAILAQDPALAQPALVDAVESPAAEPPAAAAAPELPSGVVSFVLTDIEGSSGLWEADFAGMAAALELHDSLIAGAAEAHGGRVLKTKGEGDSTVTVFRRASDAVAAAAAIQVDLAGAAWPGAVEPRVRIAVHTGEAHERDGDYFGPALNRAARLRGLAHGGAVLLSQATAEIVQDRLPDGFELSDLGRRDLRGLSRPEQVFELREADAGGSAPPAPVRKVVTVLFACADDAGADGSGLDAEARRRRTSELLGELREILERHGGTVQKYPGEALMAVYGVPRLHEDDAARAVRAAAELREHAPTLRIGIGTGEVIAEPESEGRAGVDGDAVNTAKRLQERAQPGETLIDERTRRLVDGSPQGLDSPLVGRAQQLEALERVFAATCADRTCHLLTVLGPAGIGKSRLVDEFTSTLGDQATVLCGRCLSYGDGITYWPLAEMVRALPGGLAAHVADDPRAEEIVTVISDAVGLGHPSGAVTRERIFWAARRLLEAVARERPVVVVLDDLQWAEATFLDLVEYVADLARDAPIVLLCMARPELLEGRSGWAGGKLNATSIHLEPLAPGETTELVTNLLSRADAPPEAVARVREASGGNPLFAEELLTMLLDEGQLGPDDVPPTIHVLLAARLERLPDDQRALLARVSVVGTVFYRDAAEELAPPELGPAVDRHLTELVRRDLIRPERSTFFGDDAYRFRHILLRDAAYRSLPKEVRAQLHERLADWMERVAGTRLTELEEIVGYHLEQAYCLVAELGADGERLAVRASERLESAGRRALGRSDLAAAIGLLERAASLLEGHDARRAALLPDLGAALIEAGRLAEAAEALDAAT
ncbi:MAG TPA: BTAD domain-containing putative transcriptional regulator, partial [Thermoleophilaceae bacterium]|nr:BTAD domain-containing putative transcriptional regulator [Thermoleophilaceae bacterium]